MHAACAKERVEAARQEHSAVELERLGPDGPSLIQRQPPELGDKRRTTVLGQISQDEACGARELDALAFGLTLDATQCVGERVLHRGTNSTRRTLRFAYDREVSAVAFNNRTILRR